MVPKKRWIRTKTYLCVTVQNQYNPTYTLKKSRNRVYGASKNSLWFSIPISEILKAVK